MTSISDDQTLPLDLDGTSNVLSNSSQYGNHDSTNTMTSSLSSDHDHEIEQPGTFPNLTSAGRLSPHRTRTMKDQELQLGELKKENFGLKLRIYHLEEALRNKFGQTDKGWQLNIELQVQLEDYKKELAEKDRLLVRAKAAMDHMTAKAGKKSPANQERMEELEDQLAEANANLRKMEEDLDNAHREADDANERLGETSAENQQLAAALRDKDAEMGRMDQELADLRQALAERAAPAATPTSRASAAQTVEPYPDNAAELGAVQASLAQRERELGELQEALAQRDRRIQEVEHKLLSVTQEMAANAGDFAQRMRAKDQELEQYKARLRDADERLRDKEAELGQCGRERDAERQRARELEAQVRRLQPLIQEREREIQDLRDRLADAERQLQDGDYDRDKEMNDLRKKLKEARAKAREAEQELANRQREEKRLTDELDDREDEIRRLRSKVRELEDALSQSKISARTADVERNEQAEALERLQQEMEALRRQLMRQKDGVQHDVEGALAAKDAIIEQLRRELENLHNQLAEADKKYQTLNTTTAAEIGVLKATIDDLTRQLEQLQKLLRAREEEVGQLRGEKAGLQREVDRLARENRALRDEVSALKDELAKQAAGMEQAEEAIAELRKLLENLQDQQPRVNPAELASLRGQVAALELALKGKEAELDGLMQTLGLKDRTIQELQQELRRLRAERASAQEKVRELEQEKARLEAELSELQSQVRIHNLSLGDLQDRLTQAYADKEELARKLKLAEEALRDKEAAYQDIEDMYKQLNAKLLRLQHQLKDLHSSPTRVTVTHHHEATPPSPPKAEPKDKDPSSNTTMIFGNLSESLFLTILQRLQELYSEITGGRADSKMASSSLAAKLEHLTALQRHLEDSLREASMQESPGKGASPSTYNSYYYMRGEGQKGSSEDEEGVSHTTSTPRGAGVGVSPQKLREREAEIEALRAELEEMKRWNEALQARLDESRRTRHVGVGMEKGAKATAHAQTGDGGVSAERFAELSQEVDRLLEELAREREKSRAERQQQEQEVEAVQGTLRKTETKVMDLEERLKAAMLRDANTSTEHFEEVERLVSELEGARATIARLRGQLEGAQKNLAELRGQHDHTQSALAKLRGKVEGAHANIADLRGQLDRAQRSNAELRGKLRFENEENKRLRDEMADISLTSSENSPQKEGEGLAATTSLPNLLATPAGARNVADSWTSPPSARAERLDVSALKAKNENITRLNAELQRKCHEQLLRTPPHSRPGSAGQSSWQTKARETEEVLRAEMMERERALLSQLHEAESRLLEKEAECQAKVAGLRQEGVELETQLAEAMKEKQSLRTKVIQKEEEILNLTRAAAKSREKTEVLEERVDQLLTEKNTVIRELEQRIRQLERELQLSRESAERLRRSLQALEGFRGAEGVDAGGEEGVQAEVLTLHETLDQLSQQLAESQEESHNLKQKHHSLGDQKSVLSDQLTSCQEQVRTLQSELAIYQQLLEDVRKTSAANTGTQASPVGGEGGASKGGVLEERVLRLLQEVSSLREQLDTSIRSNNSLAEQLREKLGHHTSFSVGGASPRTGADKGRGSGSSWDHTHKHRSVHATITSTLTSGSQTKGASFSPHSSPKLHRRSINFTDSPSPKNKSDSFGRSGGGANLDSSSSSSFLSSSSRVLEGEGSGGRGTTRARPTPQAQQRTTTTTSSFTLRGLGDFDTLESRLQRALDSPALQGQDRTFLEELLLYLQQQRRQLDESRRLLENLEQEHPRLFEGGGIPQASHISGGGAGLRESGTVPSSSHLTSVASPSSPRTSTPHHSTTATSTTQFKSSTSYGTQTGAGSSFNTQHGARTTSTVSGTPTLSATGALTYSTSGTQHGTQTGAYGTRPLSTTGAQTHSTSGTQHGTQTGSGLYGTTTTRAQTHSTSSTQYGSRTLHTQNGTQAAGVSKSRVPGTGSYRSMTLTTHGVQTSHSPSLSPRGRVSSPRGVATVGLVTRSTSVPVVNGYGGGGASGGGGVAEGTGPRGKVDLASLYEQLLQTQSSLVEARSALSQQQQLT